MRSPMSKKPWNWKRRSYDNRRPKFQPSFKRQRVEGPEKFPREMSQHSRERRPSEGLRDIYLQDMVSQKSKVEPKLSIDRGHDCSLENESQVKRDMVGLKGQKNILQENVLRNPANHKGDVFHAPRSRFNDSDQRLTFKAKSNDVDAIEAPLKHGAAISGKLKSSSQQSLSHSWERQPSEDRENVSFPRDISLKDVVSQKSMVEPKPSIDRGRDRSLENEERIRRDNVGLKGQKNIQKENALRGPANHKDDAFHAPRSRFNDRRGMPGLKEQKNILQENAIKVPANHKGHAFNPAISEIKSQNSDEGKAYGSSSSEIKSHQEQVGFQHLFGEKIIVVNTQGEARGSEQTLNNDEQHCFFYVADHRVADDRIQKLKQLKDDRIVLISDRYHVHDSRKRVIKALDLFEDVHAVRFKAYKAEQNRGSVIHQKIDVRTAMALKHEGKWVYNERVFVGNVPGVYIGDQFRLRAELAIVGLHRTFYSGIHYVKIQGKNYAVSIVNSGRYKNQSISPDSFIYVDHGGNLGMAGKEPVDQELKYGNLSLKNSRDKGVPVRVTRACRVRGENSRTNNERYIYEGLFVVTSYWQERVQHGKTVFMFELHRMSNQPSFTPEMSVKQRRVGTWFHDQALKERRRAFGIGRPFLNGKRTRGVFKSSLRCQAVERVVVDDVSQGKENIAIRVVSDRYAERPLPFTYTANMIYPHWYHPSVPLGCDCTNGCSDSGHCYCAFRNGGEIPYNTRGAIIKPKPVIHECGPACKCPPSCRNRVSQRGIRYHLEIFRTKPSGWGVRSRDYISSGSFICEFVGELLDKKEAKQRIGHLQYFFPIGNSEKAIPHDSCTAIAHPAKDSSSQYKYGDGYIIDASCSGNVARFINRSSSPNLYVQNVLYEGVPHIMLFACKNIPPMQEFTYDYNCSNQSDAK